MVGCDVPVERLRDLESALVGTANGRREQPGLAATAQRKVQIGRVQHRHSLEHYGGVTRHPHIALPVQIQLVHPQEPVVVADVAVCVGSLVHPRSGPAFHHHPIGAAARPEPLEHVGRLLQVPAFAVEVVKQLLAGDKVAFLFEAYMARDRQLPLREGVIKIIREHRGAALAQHHIALSLQLAILMSLQPVGVEKNRRRVAAAF